jgi:two-component sensor histidine kinase
MKGPVWVEFSGESEHWRLAVRDEGVGLPVGFDPNEGRSVGMRVITALARRLNAKLTFKSGRGGTVFEIER